MKIIKKEERESFSTKTIRAYEYPFGTKNIDCSVVEIFGRHPLEGWSRNTKVDEMIYCKKGTGKIVFTNGEYDLKEDDAVFIEKGEWYYWDAKTNGVFIPICNPAWSSEQCETKNKI
jgi:mannose-6-phosphate isomerase-like protein (cupin superfamily)